MSDANQERNRAFQVAFEQMHSQGVEFPSLVLQMLKHHKHSVASVSVLATTRQGCPVPPHQIRNALHGRIAPTESIRQAIQEAIGFDPWAVVDRPNLPGQQKAFENIVAMTERAAHDDDSGSY